MPRGVIANPVTRILCGPARSERCARVSEFLLNHWGNVLLIVPSNRLATQRIEELLLSGTVPGAWGRPVMTFQMFAGELLRERDVNLNLLDEFERRAILERAIDTLRSGNDFDKIAGAAATPGFVSHMLRVIAQLKQAAIEPGEFRSRIMESGRRHWLDSVVASVYEAYQSALIASKRYDLVGLYWQAELACRERQPKILHQVRHVVLDGFDDFTPSEFRLLEMVAPHIESLIFSIGCSMSPASQRDLYATPRDTVHRLVKAFHARVEELPEPPPARFSAYIAQHLFWRDFPPPAPSDSDDIALAVYTNPTHEIEAVARAAKHLILDDGVPPRAIAVVYRDLSEHAEMIRTVFDDAGVPVHVDERPPLTQSGIGRFLLALLDVAPGFRRDAVIDVLTSPFFAPHDCEIDAFREGFSELARLAQIVGGRRDWATKMSALPTVVADAASRKRLRPSVQDTMLAAATSLQKAWTLLTAVVDAWNGATTDGAFIEALRSAVVELGCVAALEKIPDERWRKREHAAFEALEILVDRLASWASDGTVSSNMATRVHKALAAASYAVEQPRDGVQALNLETARYLAFDHVFFCGLVEGAVPNPPAASAIYTDRDVEAFDQMGIALETRQARNARERLLFHHGLGLARTRLYLSWHARSREDKEVGASPFLADVRELAGDRLHVLDARIEPVPALDAVVSLRELRNAAVASELTVAGFESELQDVLRAAAIERSRYGSAPFDHYDGQLLDTALKTRVQLKFGADHQFSARQLEAYARCPFRFFAQEVFKLEPVEEPAPEIDAMLRGQIMHAALQHFHETYRDQPVASIVPEAAEASMRAAVDRAWDRLAARDRATPEGVHAAEISRLTAQLLRYLDFERAAGETWQPAHFEVSFGRTVRDHADGWSRDDVFVLTTPAGPVRLGGIIDRIDARDGDLRIIDYKNSISMHSNRALNDGVDLQLLLYAEAVERHLAVGRTCVAACYVHVGRKDSRDCLGNDGAERRAALPAKVGEYIQGIRDGRFHPRPYHDSCTYCDMRRVCRYDAGRVARKDTAT